jgi:hypothetical protein
VTRAISDEEVGRATTEWHGHRAARAVVRPDGVVHGGGGAFGIAFHMGVLHAFAEAGIPVLELSMTGLSAGSYAAAALVTGTPLSTVAEAWCYVERTKPAGELVRGHRITERIFGDARDPRVTGVCLSLPLPRRVLVDGGRHRLADVVAASSSPWGLAYGHPVDGRLLYDAGTVSNTAADRAPSADLLLVLAPLARGVLGRQGGFWEMRLRGEARRGGGGRGTVARWRSSVPIRTWSRPAGGAGAS